MKKDSLISKERYKDRMTTCLDCEHYSSSLNRCKKCGCFLILKAALKDTKCPMGKWKNKDDIP